MDQNKDNSIQMQNHKQYCRLCIENSKNRQKIQITTEIQQLFHGLQIEVCLHFTTKVSDLISVLNFFYLQMILTSNYSNFICDDCFIILSQSSLFRSKIYERQRELSRFLCSIKDETIKNEETDGETSCDNFIDQVFIKEESVDESFSVDFVDGWE